jgi:serine/threonine-protein kinase
MSGSGSEPDLLGQLAEEFLERYRLGERPALAEYAARHPDLAEQIRELFPALVLMEDVRPGPPTAAGAAAESAGAGSPRRLGEYRIVREIGRGGMGVVYEAEQESLGRRVALKMLPPGAAAHPRHVERFQREARAAARLHHTNIVPVFAVGEEGGTHYYVMQYIEGRPLDEVLAELRRLRDRAGPRAGAAPDPEPAAPDGKPSSAAVARSLWHGRVRAAPAHDPPEAGGADGPARPAGTVIPPPPSDPPGKARGTPASSGLLSDAHRPYAKSVAHLGAQAADALEYAAGQGVLHRDVKPSNLLLDVWGTVWLTDFGLAKAAGTPDLTRTSDVLGTLHYMAPERFRGQADVRSDVYALGLTLYEMLALRPAFGDGGQEQLIGQITSEGPPRLDRVNPHLPRDLVTIIHKATAREPADRYPTAGALAEDLRRFLDDRSILARRVRFHELAWRWCRRNPTMAGLLAGSLLLTTALVFGGVWLALQQAQRRHAVDADLTAVAGLQERARWPEARAALERAEARLGGGGPGDLRVRLGQARHDLDLAAQLDDIRVKRVSSVEVDLNHAQADRDYEDAFREAGLGKVYDDPKGLAARVRASAVRGALVAALDDWSVYVTDPGRRSWLLEVARGADPDPQGWRDRARDPAVWEDGAALAELARTAPLADLSVSLLVALGERMKATGGDAIAFLRRVQREHPADFWANLTLGDALRYQDAGEAIAYYRVALAIRPGVAVGYYDLAEVLRVQGWHDEAVDYYRKALRIAPRDARAQTGLCNLLRDTGRLDEAIDHFRQAVRTDPENVSAHVNLGSALRDTGRLDEAADHFRRAIALDSKSAAAQNGLRSVLLRQGRGEEARAAWQKCLEANPPEHDAWFGYAELCAFLGQEDEYRRARRALLDRFGASTDPYVAERTGRACLLLPASEDELGKADALIDRAVTDKGAKYEWAYPYFLFAKGLAEYRHGRLDGAIWMLQGGALPVLGPAPRLVVAMAQHRRGQKEEARKTLAAAVLAYDWSAGRADNRDAWICHVLRREAEAMILPDLPAFLGGTYQPRDNDERLALLGVCQFQGLGRAAARLYAGAFADDPKLADDFQAGRRYGAARCAARAAADRGKEAEKLDDPERARLRQQALGWLRADLAAWAGAADRTPVPRTLRRWQQDADLAGVRDPEALAQLPQPEREAWAQLWSDVADLLRQTGGPK